jgi:hypothetical protein
MGQAVSRSEFERDGGAVAGEGAFAADGGSTRTKPGEYSAGPAGKAANRYT